MSMFKCITLIVNSSYIQSISGQDNFPADLIRENKCGKSEPLECIVCLL